MRRGGDANERLSAAGKARSMAQLLTALDDASPEVAKAAVSRLVEVAGSDAAPELRARLLDADPSLVGTIAVALSRLNDSVAIVEVISGRAAIRASLIARGQA